MTDCRHGLVETHIPPVLSFNNPDQHQVGKDWVIQLPPITLIHLLPSTNHISPQLVVSQTLFEDIIMPTIGVEDFLRRKSMTKLHLFHNLEQRVRSIKLIEDSGQPVGWWDTGWNLPEHQPNDFKGQTSCKIVLDTFHGNRRWRTPNRMCYGPWDSKKR